MDTISCGATIAWAMDCYEQGLITSQDTGGLELNFGNAAAVVTLTQQIANREGFRRHTGRRFRPRSPQKLGPTTQDLVVAVKKHELPAHMPEAKRSLALIYAVNPYGADHQSHEHDPSYTPDWCYSDRMAEVGLLDPQPPDNLNAQKVRYSLYTQWIYNAMNSLCVCQFIFGSAWRLYSTGQFAELVRAATGWDLQPLRTHEDRRTYRPTCSARFNAREGFTKANNTLPQKLPQPRKGGPTDGVFIPPRAGWTEPSICTTTCLAGTPKAAPAASSWKNWASVGLQINVGTTIADWVVNIT